MRNRRTPITPAEARETMEAIAANGGNKSAAARAMGIPYSALQRRCRKADFWGITAHGSLEAAEAQDMPAAPRGQVTRYLLTSAQSNTHCRADFLQNLRALADHYGAQLMVARLRYNHSAQQLAQEKDNRRRASKHLWYDSELSGNFADKRLRLAPGLIWAGDMNILPTASDPLSGLDEFCGSDSVIFPHPRIALKSVATAPGLDAKQILTTGSVTLSNYISRKAGMKAEFHHSYAAVLVEVCPDGTWFARHVNAGSDGEIYDLDLCAAGGQVTSGHRIEVLTPGDLHGRRVDLGAFAAHWGPFGICAALRPRVQVLHDVLDFEARSHHNHALDALRLAVSDLDSVADEIAATAQIINDCAAGCGGRTYIAKANHDEHLERWLREADWRRDPKNAQIYLRLASQWADALTNGEDFDPAIAALRAAGVCADVDFLDRNAELSIAGIRHDMHGDLGPNGARGSVRNLSRIASKINLGHSHAPAIHGGAYQAGTLSQLDLGYNRGPSSWAHASIITYAHGKRAIITIKNGKWRA